VFDAELDQNDRRFISSTLQHIRRDAQWHWRPVFSGSSADRRLHSTPYFTPFVDATATARKIGQKRRVATRPVGVRGQASVSTSRWFLRRVRRRRRRGQFQLAVFRAAAQLDRASDRGQRGRSPRAAQQKPACICVESLPQPRATAGQVSASTGSVYRRRRHKAPSSFALHRQQQRPRRRSRLLPAELRHGSSPRLSHRLLLARR